jgi:histidine triad (HIT) family protein
MTTIFTKIINGEIPGNIVYRDDKVVAFKDINPQAPVHILIVPIKAIVSVNEVGDEDEAILGRMLLAAKQIAEEQGVAEGGYRLIINNGTNAHQEVFHLHMHLLGGRALGPLLVKRD